MQNGRARFFDTLGTGDTKMNKPNAKLERNSHAEIKPPTTPDLPGQVVLVMQGGGALGAFQAGVYQAMHEAGIEPDWVVGTSIGAINASIIAGNMPQDRLPRLKQFWEQVASEDLSEFPWNLFGARNQLQHIGTVLRGVPGFFQPNPRSWLGEDAVLGVTEASFYSTDPLRVTLGKLVNFDYLEDCSTRLTLGAVNVRSGRMHYFDSRDGTLGVDHVMASGALPPAFPAVMIDGEPYWDGGVYSNTPLEVVMDDNPRRDSLIFAAQLWQQEDGDPQSLREVMSRQKDIQYSSRSESHTERQQQIHHLRHIVRQLGLSLPEAERSKPEVKQLLGWGCGTVIHLVSMQVPALEGEDYSKDIDFIIGDVDARWDAGLALARKRIVAAPWQNHKVDPEMGIIVHDSPVT
jgi:NTE family protein